MAVTVTGSLAAGLTAKDLALGIIRALGPGGGTGTVIEYRGAAVRGLSMAGRMTLCNMSIECGARAGMISPDDITFGYLRGRPHSPRGARWERALNDWRGLATDAGARFDREVTVGAATIVPAVTWGTTPAQSVSIDAVVPDPASFATAGERQAARRALDYMDLRPGTAIRDVPVDAVFPAAATGPAVARLLAALAADPAAQVALDVAGRVIEVPSAGLAEPFGLDDFARRRLLEGLDDIALTLRHADSITGYETNRPPWLPALRRSLP